MAAEVGNRRPLGERRKEAIKDTTKYQPIHGATVAVDGGKMTANFVVPIDTKARRYKSLKLESLKKFIMPNQRMHTKEEKSVGQGFFAVANQSLPLRQS